MTAEVNGSPTWLVVVLAVIVVGAAVVLVADHRNDKHRS